MKFIFADSLDFVDPRFDFVNDINGEGREPYWDDVFPHEIFEQAPYDGVLISRATVGDAIYKGKYTESQSMRFRRVGAREHLRLNTPEHIEKPIFGDNGAFSYSSMAEPPYTAKDTVEFYGDGKFTHGCSVDHIIFEFDSNAKGMGGGTDDSRKRYEITLQLASEFYEESKQLKKSFTPIGVIQGWSPGSLAASATELVKMGYRYLAIGGLVPLKSDEIHLAVAAVHDAVKKWPSVKLHLLGFAKADTLHEFTKYSKIASFDSTSPLIKAFKDSVRNYYEPLDDRSLNYYTAIRIPQAIENNILKNHAKTGLYRQEDLLKMERSALKSVRDYSKGKCSLENTLDSLIEYSEPLQTRKSTDDEALKRKLHTLRTHYKRTLENKPWEKCDCNICRDIGVETIIFRASNRNRRRGFHNLKVYYDHLQRINNL